MKDIYFVYIMASKRRGTLYVGVTNDLVRRVHEHRTGSIEGFTSKYLVKHLVWYESTSSIDAAITHEKRVKRWRRDWKFDLVETTNPEWRDLYEEISQ